MKLGIHVYFKNYITLNQSKRIFFAIHDYQSTSREDISFVKGDRLVILDDSDDDWWRVRNLRTRSKGLIPKYFVVPEGSLDSPLLSPLSKNIN
uniref:CSON014214 protein n=1 Tax=Culicoides sonorensis TaxID=179676 RepID=A0A336MCS7_CULSO